MRFITLLLCLLSPMLSYGQFTPETQEEDDLVYIFYNYKAAVDRLDVEGAARYLDSNTMKFYDEVLLKIKTAEEDALLEMDFTSWYMVMFVRFMAPEGSIGKMETGKDVLLFMMRNNLRGQLHELEVMDVDVYDKNAVVYVMKEGQIQDAAYNFVQYGDADWRLDYTKRFATSNQGLQVALGNKEIMIAYNHDKKTLLNTMIKNNGWHQGGRDLWKVRQ
jgi:hypothetical protein